MLWGVLWFACGAPELLLITETSLFQCTKQFCTFWCYLLSVVRYVLLRMWRIWSFWGNKFRRKCEIRVDRWACSRNNVARPFREVLVGSDCSQCLKEPLGLPSRSSVCGARIIELEATVASLAWPWTVKWSALRDLMTSSDIEERFASVTYLLAIFAASSAFQETQISWLSAHIRWIWRRRRRRTDFRSWWMEEQVWEQPLMGEWGSEIGTSLSFVEVVLEIWGEDQELKNKKERNFWEAVNSYSKRVPYSHLSHFEASLIRIV